MFGFGSSRCGFIEPLHVSEFMCPLRFSSHPKNTRRKNGRVSGPAPILRPFIGWEGESCKGSDATTRIRKNGRQATRQKTKTMPNPEAPNADTRQKDKDDSRPGATRALIVIESLKRRRFSKEIYDGIGDIVPLPRHRNVGRVVETKDLE